MPDQDITKLSIRSNFTLVGESGKERLAFNGNIVSVSDLKMAGFLFGVKYKQSCSICSPSQKVQWHEVTITCKNEWGPIWLCPNCSIAYIHERRGKPIWAELLKTLKADESDSEVNNSPSSFVSSYLPNKEDFESAYRSLTCIGEEISIDSVLNQIENNSIKNGQLLKNNWRMITEMNIGIWSK